jgi:hypothetical protein
MIFLAPQEGCLNVALFGGRPEALADDLSPAFEVRGRGQPRPRTALRIPECGHSPYYGMNAGLSRIVDRWALARGVGRRLVTRRRGVRQPL